jgi:hypothetical protein
VDLNGRDAMEGASKIFGLFSVSQSTLILVLKCGAHRSRPQFRPPISANLRTHIDERQFHLGNNLVSNFAGTIQPLETE